MDVFYQNKDDVRDFKIFGFTLIQSSFNSIIWHNNAQLHK